jgi:hypothetical protein
MYFNNYNESEAYGIAHVETWSNDPIDRPLSFLEKGSGSRDGCLRSICRRSESTAMVLFFRDCNLLGMKQWAYASAKSRIMLAHLQPGQDYLTEDLLWPLISDNEEVIDWYRQHRAVYDLDNATSGGDKNDPKNWMFYRYQSWLALNTRWNELGERCERILAMQDEIKKDRSYLIDQRFYLALARGDKEGMEKVLLEKTAPIERKRRHEQESSLTHNFIVSYATIFAKLAWRNGYSVEVDTPWIPKAWLPVIPLSEYNDPWPFMKAFNIWQSFEGDRAPWSPKRHSNN